MADNENPLSAINWQTILSSFDDPLTLLQWLKKIVEEQGSQTITALSIEPVEAGVVKFVITMENGDTIESDNFSYVTPSALSTALAGKLDKVTSTATLPRCYTIKNDGTNEVTPYSTSATASSIAYRGTDGTLKVGTPTADGDATTKKYVDDRVSGTNDGTNWLTLTIGGNTYAVTGGGGGSATWGGIIGTLSNQTDLQNALDAKLDKVSTTSGYYRLYTVHPDGTQTLTPFASSFLGNSVMYRNLNGNSQVSMPNNNYDIANKKYVDDAISGAVSPHLYRHNIRLYLASTYDITFTYISNSDTAITSSTIADLFPSGASRSASGGVKFSTRAYSVVCITRGSATEFTVYGVGNDSNNAYDEQDDDFAYSGATVTDVVETIL